MTTPSQGSKSRRDENGADPRRGGAGANARLAPRTNPRLEPIATPEAQTFGLVAPDGRPLVPAPLEASRLEASRLREVYRSMRRVRALDERMMMHQRQGRIGFYGASTGQEAVAIAVAEALRAEDWIFPALREAPAMLHRGYDLVTYLCQIFGNEGDVLQGRNMPSHMADRRVNQVSWSSVIGTQISQAVGAAYAARYRKDPVVIVAFMGDGATSSADFHTGLNFAAVWQVPVVFVCQNNHWSISVPTSSQTASASIAHKALAYGIPGFRVDGNDALAVHRAARDAVDRARAGGGPALLECVTYRIGAHSSSDDPRVYRDESEVELWRTLDPVDRLQRLMLGQGWLTEEEDARIEAEVRAEVAAAVSEAEAKPAPPVDTLFTDVFGTSDWRIEEQRRAYLDSRQEGE